MHAGGAHRLLAQEPGGQLHGHSDAPGLVRLRSLPAAGGRRRGRARALPLHRRPALWPPAVMVADGAVPETDESLEEVAVDKLSFAAVKDLCELSTALYSERSFMDPHDGDEAIRREARSSTRLNHANPTSFFISGAVFH
jgi:hypothetical protein